MLKPSWFSRYDTCKEGTTLKILLLLVQELDRIFTQRNLVVLELQHDALSGEMTPWGAAIMSTGKKPIRSFARSISSPCCPLTGQHS